MASPVELALIRYNLGIANSPCTGCKHLTYPFALNPRCGLPKARDEEAAQAERAPVSFALINRNMHAERPSEKRACGKEGKYYEPG